MSRSINKVQLIGNVGQDPEVRSTQNGCRVATFSLATSRKWKTANGDQQEKTEWHRCVAWNIGKNQGLADIIDRYVRKGDKLFVEGSIEYRQWEDREGVTRYATEIRVRELLMLGGAGAPRETSPYSDRPSAANRRNDDNDFEDIPDVLMDEDDDLPF